MGQITYIDIGKGLVHLLVSLIGARAPSSLFNGLTIVPQSRETVGLPLHSQISLR
jgi:hypothetical protein